MSEYSEETRKWLEDSVDFLRGVLTAWEPRVRCPQCGQRYSETACGFAHVQIQGWLDA